MTQLIDTLAAWNEPTAEISAVGNGKKNSRNYFETSESYILLGYIINNSYSLAFISSLKTVLIHLIRLS